ncbi:MAG: acetyl-CoA hydrolase, partial [Synergistetes bacterium]|nr:acetyl-CoA hydrolase [Synergistota bacterium]
MKALSKLKERLRNENLLSKVTQPDYAASLIKNGMTVACSGFTHAGYPKVIPLALAERAEREESLRITLWTGASVGPELDGALASAIERRLPYQSNSILRERINAGEVDYIDVHLSQFSQMIRYGFFPGIDFAIIEAVAITEDGGIVPSTSVGNSPTFVRMAKKVMVEINLSQPLELEGIHDIHVPEDPPLRREIPIYIGDERIGLPFIPCPSDKIEAIVISDIPDNQRPWDPLDEISKRMGDNLIDFLRFEVKKGRLPKDLLPLQSGTGSVANAVFYSFLNSEFHNLRVYTEVIQDSMLDLIDAGKLRFVSGTAFGFSPSALSRFYEGLKKYRQYIVLRPQEISNHPEVIRRLGVIAMNTAIEVDIYGHVNSTNLLGSRMMNGIGGSGDFSRNAYLSIFQTPSTAKGGAISKIVPMVSHVDHTEHEVHLIVTEWGVADL